MIERRTISASEARRLALDTMARADRIRAEEREREAGGDEEERGTAVMLSDLPWPDIPGVRFADIPGFRGYCVGDNGTVWSSKKGRGWKTHRIGCWREMTYRYKKRTQHVYVKLYDNQGRRFYLFVHRLVLEAFVGPCPAGMECCHDPDPDPTNNRLVNLRWDTHAANMADSRRLGRTCNKGQRNGRAKLTETDVIEIRRLSSRGVTKKAIATQFGVVWTTVHMIIQRTNWSYLP